jgi:hypothetical protein
VNLIQAIVWNVGIYCFDDKGKTRKPKSKGESTDAKQRDGVIRSSDEIAVMAMERRGHIVQCV